MIQTHNDSRKNSTPDIRIVGLNSDKTRKTYDSDVQYQVYFQLSGSPPRAWRDLFETEWKQLHQTDSKLYHDTVIDRGFLILHAPLQEIALQLPVLKKAIAATNRAYDLYVQEQRSQQSHLDEAWRVERKAVNDIAASLRFD